MKGRDREVIAAGHIPVGRRAMQAIFYAFVLWIPLETVFVFENDGDSTVTLSRVLGAVLFLAAAFTRKISFRRFPPAFWLVAWYAAIYSMSQLWIPTEVDQRFLEQQVTLMQMIALFAISINLFANEEFRSSLARAYGWWMAAVAVLLLAGAFGEPAKTIDGRSTILGQDPNVAAGFFALGAVCLVGDRRLLQKTGLAVRASLTAAATAAILAAVLQTGSRGGLIVFVAGMAGLLAVGRRSTLKTRMAMTVFVVGLLAFMIYQEFQNASATAGRLMEAVDRGETAGRTNIWATAWSMFLERPFLGYGGANNFTTLGTHLNYGAYRDTHNLFLALLTEVGVIGALPFIAAMFLAAYKSLRWGLRTGDSRPFALMCALFAINLSLTGHHDKLFWVFFAAAVACGLQYDEEAVAERRERKAA
jgi:O-antigen ligase